MAFFVITQAPERFRALACKAGAARKTCRAIRSSGVGYDAFFNGDCQSCHAIRGTPATATRGPDLTHVGSRTSLAAGVLDNHIGTMAGWIAGAQDVKPGNAMPSMPLYTGAELRALAAWLGSLQ